MVLGVIINSSTSAKKQSEKSYLIPNQQKRLYHDREAVKNALNSRDATLIFP
jgi:hypothetical protein